jgi:hypothetical protein
MAGSENVCMRQVTCKLIHFLYCARVQSGTCPCQECVGMSFLNSTRKERITAVIQYSTGPPCHHLPIPASLVGVNPHPLTSPDNYTVQ